MESPHVPKFFNKGNVDDEVVFNFSDTKGSQHTSNESADMHNNRHQGVPNVKGRLKANIHFWEEIGASNWVLRILREGYVLPFISEPEAKNFRNNSSVTKNKEFVTQEVLDLLGSGRVREVSADEIKVINPLTVADNGEN